MGTKSGNLRMRS
jgi:hypothetical protein